MPPTATSSTARRWRCGTPWWNCNGRSSRRPCRCGSTPPSRVFPPPQDAKGKYKQSRLLKRDAARLRIKAAQQRIGLVDGAVCLRGHMEGLGLDAVGLDFYHLMEHVHQGRRQTFGESAEQDPSDPGRRWAGELLHTVKHEGYEPFWQKLVEWRRDQRGRAKRQCADGLLHYVAERREMIAYDKFARRGWQIGSGPMEAMCKATTRRLKGVGMRWDRDHAEEMMGLESLYQSNLWDRYWSRAMWQQN